MLTTAYCKTTPRRRCRRPRDQGSIFVEFLIVFPVFASLWLLTIYAGGFHTAALDNQRVVRRCAWAYAMSGCRSLPPGCPVNNQGVVPDGQLRGAARGQFEVVGQNLPFLGRSLVSLHGDWFEMQQERTVPRPRAFGGQVQTDFRFRIMCNVLPESWNTRLVFEQTCRIMGIWCS